jgi:hypothetical protein
MLTFAIRAKGDESGNWIEATWVPSMAGLNPERTWEHLKKQSFDEQVWSYGKNDHHTRPAWMHLHAFTDGWMRS